MRTLLVDSDETLRTNLWNLLKLYQNFALAGEADTAEAAVSFVQQHPVDVIFINHQPAEPCRTSTGDWVAYLLAQTHPDVQVVLYADTADWAFQAFRSQCAGYLLLPFDPLALQALVNRLRYVFDLQQTKREAANRSLLIKTRSGYQLTPGQRHFVCRAQQPQKPHRHPVRRRDPPAGLHNEPVGTDAGRVRFLRCYQSFIVNLSKVSFIRADGSSKTYAIQFDSYDGEVLLSRDKYPELLTLLKEKYANINF